MFTSLLPAVTLVALGLLVPASGVAMMLARGRHAAPSSGLDRGMRVTVATMLAGAAGGLAAWLLDAGPAAAAVTALLLAAPVVAWAYLAPWWPVRAVVAWSMLVTGAIGLVALGTARALESAEPWTAVPVAAAGAAAVVLVLERLNGPFRRLLGIRAGVRRAVRTPLFLRPVLLRPALAMAVFFAALAAGGLTGVAPGTGGARAPQAGAGPEPGRGPAGGRLDASDVTPVSASSVTPSEVGNIARAAASGSLGGPDGAGGAAGSRSGTAGTSAGTARSATGDTAPRPGPQPGDDDGAGRSGSGSGSGSTGGGGDDGRSEDDPVRQVVDTVEGTVRTVTDPVGGVTGDEPAGGDPLEPVAGTVEEVTSTVEDTVEPVASTVEDTVDQVTGPLGSSLP